MTDELEVKGLDFSLDDQDTDGYDFYNHDGSQQELMNIFEGLGLFMTKSIISIIQEFCKPGITCVHTSDGGEFALSLKAVRLSKLLNSEAEINPFGPIYVDKCTGDIFSLVSEYLTHHNGVEPASIAKPIRSVRMREIVEDPWDAEFANRISKRKTFKVISAANYIDCQSLLHLMCAKIATLTKGKSSEEIRRNFAEEDPDETENNQPERNHPEPEILDDTEALIEDDAPEPLALDHAEAPIEDNAHNGELEPN